MSNAVITLQLGQCGNQIGFEFWKGLCTEHGISPNGELLHGDPNSCSTEGNADVFFYQADDKRFVPRSVLMDLEPRVINSIFNSDFSKLFTQENVLLSAEGGGAGNNWANGYQQSQKLEEDLYEIMDRMAEDCEMLEGTMIIHSMAGGTGSGAGSFIIEGLADHFPKKIVKTFSVFPHQNDMGDVIVQPYNSLLMLQHLIEYADSVLVMDNAAFQNIIENHLKVESPTYMEMNALMTKIMSVYTNPLRFPTYDFNTLTSLAAAVTQTPYMHFLTPSFSPWNTAVLRKKSLPRIMFDLLKPGNMVLSGKRKNAFEHGYLSILDIILGKYDHSKVFDAIRYIRENEFAKFVPWVPDSMQILLGKRSPYYSKTNYNSGLMVANHTSIGIFFEQIVHDFDKLRKRKAFLGQFGSTGLFSKNFEEMDLARDVVDRLLQEYEAATMPSYLQWTPEKRGKSESLSVSTTDSSGSRAGV